MNNLPSVNNGVINGLCTSKNGRAWLDGEFTLEELESICIEIRRLCFVQNIRPIGFMENHFIELENDNDELTQGVCDGTD